MSDEGVATQWFDIWTLVALAALIILAEMRSLNSVSRPGSYVLKMSIQACLAHVPSRDVMLCEQSRSPARSWHAGAGSAALLRGGESAAAGLGSQLAALSTGCGPPAAAT